MFVFVFVLRVVKRRGQKDDPYTKHHIDIPINLGDNILGQTDLEHTQVVETNTCCHDRGEESYDVVG